MTTAQKIIEYYGLKPLPEEGGYYTELYRSDEKITARHLPKRYASDRCYSTSILFLLTSDTFSGMHRLASDEIYHFYTGDPVELLILHPDGSSEQVTLGSDVLSGQTVQKVIPKGSWQGCYIKSPGKFALMGCTVAPGFEFVDFVIGKKDRLIKKYPDRKELIKKLCRK